MANKTTQSTAGRAAPGRSSSDAPGGGAESTREKGASTGNRGLEASSASSSSTRAKLPTLAARHDSNTVATGMTTANNTTTANSTTASSSGVAGIHRQAVIPNTTIPSLPVATLARNLEASLPLLSPRKMPPLPLPMPYMGNLVSPLPPSDPPPPPDTPSLPPTLHPVSTSTPRQPSGGKLVLVDEPSSPRAGEASPTIAKIASDIVAAELENGLNLKGIGRLSPKFKGISVYNQLAAYVNAELAESAFVEVVDKCRQAVMKRFGKNPEKLVVVEGSATDTGGEHTGVDLERIAKYLAPIFAFVCGAEQRVADSRLPKTVLSLFKAIDRELVATLLLRREQQLTAQKLWSASLPPGELRATLAELGWTDAQFKKLVEEGVFTAARIHAFRVNMFTGLLFTRCVSPFILYSADELQQASSKRIARPPQPLVKLSEGANKLFKKNFGAFVEDLIRESHSVMPEKSALALATITAGEERYSKIKKSKKSSSGSSKAFARSPGRHSAPVLPQGGEFGKLMEKEKRAADAESSPLAPGRTRPERDGPPVQSPVRRMTNSSGLASNATTTSTSTSDVRTPTPDKAMLSDERKILLERFAGKSERGPSFERYPALMERMKSRATAWAQEKTGGNFVLALKTIYEDELLKCFYRSCVLIGGEPDVSRKAMRLAISEWKTANEGKDVNLEVLWAIMPDIMPPLTLVKPTSLTRRAEAVTEALLKREAVSTEMQANPFLKKRFLHDVRSWIALGAGSNDTVFAIQQLYQDALIAQYQEGLQTSGADPVQARKVRFEALKWSEENDDALLTTAALDAIFAAIRKGA